MSSLESKTFYKRTIHLLILDGNIGSGKTTALNNLKSLTPFTDQYHVEFVDEIYEEFNSFKNFSPLELCADDPVNNGVSTQFHITLRLNRHLTQKVDSVVNKTDYRENKPILLICDRSIISPVVFISALRRMRYISNFSSEYLIDFCLMLGGKTLQMCNLRFVGMIYLELPIETCLERIKLRGRSFEKNITLSYLQALEDSYEEYIEWWKKTHGVNFIVKLKTYDDPFHLVKLVDDFMEIHKPQNIKMETPV